MKGSVAFCPAMSQQKLRVAVVGGGVCGLACAVVLLREGVDVHVYEAAVRTEHPDIRRY